jgi:hypothetical protein
MNFAVTEPEVEKVVSVRSDVSETKGGRTKIGKEQSQEKNSETESGLDNDGKQKREFISKKFDAYVVMRGEPSGSIARGHRAY